MAGEAEIVSAPCGRLAGVQGTSGSRAWLGIPYAQPPVGSRRWKAPRPAPRWVGERSAAHAGSPSLQRRVTISSAGLQLETLGSEDCLYLNVWAPARTDGPKPVMVWIHGGGNLLGRADAYDGGRLAATQDVIVVTINYRLGLLGWCAHSALG